MVVFNRRHLPRLCTCSSQKLQTGASSMVRCSKRSKSSSSTHDVYVLHITIFSPLHSPSQGREHEHLTYSISSQTDPYLPYLNRHDPLWSFSEIGHRQLSSSWECDHFLDDGNGVVSLCHGSHHRDAAHSDNPTRLSLSFYLLKVPLRAS